MTDTISRKDIVLQILNNSDFHYIVQFSHLGKVIKKASMHKDAFEKPLTKLNKVFFMLSIEEDIEKYIQAYNNNLKEVHANVT